jgi:hypothetical protein
VLSQMRSIPFTLGLDIKEHGILCAASWPFNNSLTVADRAGRPLRICMDACKINYISVPDIEEAEPVQELLQRLNGVQWIVMLDSMSSFCESP